MMDPKDGNGDHSLPAEKLEEAFDTVISKLDRFQRELAPDERAAFMELMKAAQSHAGAVQARDEGDQTKIEYMKPIQVHATYAMKERMMNLPAEFTRGGSEDEKA